MPTPTYTVTPTDHYTLLHFTHLQGMPHYNDITKAVVTAIAQGSPNFVLDISDLQYIDSVGLSLLITILTKSRNADGDVVLVQPDPKVLKMLIITKLQHLFDIKKDVASAAEVFLAQAPKMDIEN